MFAGIYNFQEMFPELLDRTFQVYFQKGMIRIGLVYTLSAIITHPAYSTLYTYNVSTVLAPS